MDSMVTTKSSELSSLSWERGSQRALNAPQDLILSSTTAGIASSGQQMDELFVFGYSCKLFRDDDKAREIDHGTHLMPWMGDETLLIDRSVSP